MATFKMKTAQKGVLPGTVHPVTFEKGKTYEIADDLAEQFRALDAIEESGEEPVAPAPDDTRPDIHEDWLDTDPAVLRHGELTAAQVIAKDESPYSEGMQPAAQPEGKAEGEIQTDEQAAGDGTATGKKKAGK